MTFMTGYQSIEGQPSTANHWLLTEVLKDEWGFRGVLVTDWDNTGRMVHEQKVCADYSEAGWTDETRKDAISHWKGVYHAPPAKPEDPLKKGTVEALLREFMAKDDYSKLSVIYILAVMLERKRILAEKDVQKREDGSRIRIYEHKKTGEIFTIPDPDLKLNELEAVQAEVNTLLGIPPKKSKEQPPVVQAPQESPGGN